jgi:nitrite reductase (NADH) large subunit
MARVIAGYECEWKKAVEDPATLRRFRHFVTTDTPDPWRVVCDFNEVLPNTGVCALVNGKQIAIFRVDDAVFAIENRDPATGMDVLSRGIVGDIRGECVVASPLFKHHYSLTTGRCIEDESLRANVYAARVSDGQVWINTQKRRLVVIGNGMAGMRTVEELLAIAPAAYEIVVFGAEPHGNYNRILLSPVLAGEKSIDDILIHSADWYARNNVTLHSGDPVVSIDRRRRIVTSQQGRQLSYDRLLIATGSKPWVPPLPGIDVPGVVTFRDLKDVDLMLDAARRYRKAVVIGGGLLGLEAASGLLRRGMDVTVVHLPDSLMERQLDPAAADLLQASLESRGLKFRMGARTRAILGEARVTGLSFEDGSTLETDLIVMTAGVRPNIDIAKQAGLQCERGLLVTDTMQTFDPSIYAVGECVQHRNITFGLVAPLWDQARVCATHLAEQGFSRFKGSIVATQLKVTGIELYSAGEFLGAEGDETIVLQDENRGVYKRIVIRDNRVRGAVLYGDTADGNWYFDLMAAQQDIGPLRDKLLFGPAFATPES